MSTSPDKPGANGAGLSRVIDLDKSRAARLEGKGEPVVVKFNGQDFTLPAEMPVEFALDADAGDLRGAIVALVGDQAADFFALKPSVEDVGELVDSVERIYGVEPGEAPASPDS